MALTDAYINASYGAIRPHLVSHQIHRKYGERNSWACG